MGAFLLCSHANHPDLHARYPGWLAKFSCTGKEKGAQSPFILPFYRSVTERYKTLDTNQQTV